MRSKTGPKKKSPQQKNPLKFPLLMTTIVERTLRPKIVQGYARLVRNWNTMPRSINWSSESPRSSNPFGETHTFCRAVVDLDSVCADEFRVLSSKQPIEDRPNFPLAAAFEHLRGRHPAPPGDFVYRRAPLPFKRGALSFLFSLLW